MSATPQGGHHEQRPSTGGSEQAWQTIHDSPGLVDLWQLHYATRNDRKHNVEERMMANTGETGCSGAWIRWRPKRTARSPYATGRTGFENSYR